MPPRPAPLRSILRVGAYAVLAVFATVLAIADSAAADRSMRAQIAQAPSSSARLGGECEYRSLPGTATIVRVEKTAASSAQAAVTGGPGYAGFEVEFSFTAKEPIKDESVQRFVARPHILQLTNSWYPGPRFLEKYGLTKGRTLNAVLQVMTKGTCTPMLFSFPDVDLTDYFESNR